MATIFSWFKSNWKCLGNCETTLNKCDLSKISEVIAKLKEIWSELEQEVIENVIQNMPIRLNKWIESEGDWIDY